MLPAAYCSTASHLTVSQQYCVTTYCIGLIHASPVLLHCGLGHKDMEDTALEKLGNDEVCHQGEMVGGETEAWKSFLADLLFFRHV